MPPGGFLLRKKKQKTAAVTRKADLALWIIKERNGSEI
jgi:hypothetical protein